MRDSTAEEHFKSPYPEARSEIGGFWRCGPHRAKFLTESVWDLKERLQDVGSDLLIRVGMVEDVIRDALEQLSDSGSEKSKAKIAGIWMTSDESIEERREQRAIRELSDASGVEFRTFRDEKYYIDESVVLYRRQSVLANID